MKKSFKKITATTMGLLLCGGLSAAVTSEVIVETGSSETVTVVERVNDAEEIYNLQEVDGMVPISFIVTVPNRALAPDNARVYTPVLVNGDWSKELPQMIVKGHSYDVVTADEVTFEEETAKTEEYYLTYTKPLLKKIDAEYDIDVEYEDEMRGSKLVLTAEDLDYNRGLKDGKTWWRKDTVDPEDTDVIRYGVVDFRHLLTYDQTVFLYDKTTIVEDFDNKSVFEIKSSKLKSDVFSAKFTELANTLEKFVAEDVHVESISVSVAASLDGPYDQNAKLAEEREAAIKSIIEKKFPKVDSNFITYSHINENWDEFVKEVKARDFYHPEISKIIRDVQDLDEREKELKATVYRKEIIEICIENRNCVITVVYQALRKFKNVDGFMVCDSESVANGSDLKVECEDQYALNNKMVELMRKGDYIDAFEVSKKITLTRPEIINNKAVLLGFLGDVPMAEFYFEKVEDMCCHDYNLAMMYMSAGEYEKALEVFGDSNCPNAIVANIMVGNYDRAVEMTRCGEYTDAQRLYLRAVAYSYTQDEKLVLFTLRQACEMDPACKELAKCQVEFMSLRDTEAYESIVN